MQELQQDGVVINRRTLSWILNAASNDTNDTDDTLLGRNDGPWAGSRRWSFERETPKSSTVAWFDRDDNRYTINGQGEENVRGM